MVNKLWGTIESLDPKRLSSQEMNEIFEIEQDMWAYWIWEFVQCECCNNIYSKNDIFGHLQKEVQVLTVSKIMSLLEIDTISCKSCDWNAKLIYDEEYIWDIEKRYKKYESFLTVYRNQEWSIKWFIDGYVAPFESIYTNELESHYGNVSIWEIKGKIRRILWRSVPNALFSFSSMGTEQKYANFRLIFNLLQHFINSIPNQYNQLLWITELDKGWNLDMIYRQMWSRDLWFSDSWNISNKSDSYNSDIYIIPHAIATYKQGFSYNIQQFLKRYRQELREIA